MTDDEAYHEPAMLHATIKELRAEIDRLREALKVKDAALAEAAVYFELEDNTALLAIMDAALAKEAGK
jgi:hypothetical protein